MGWLIVFLCVVAFAVIWEKSRNERLKELMWNYLQYNNENAKKELAKLQSSIPEREEYEEKIMHLHDAIDALSDPNLEAAAKNEFLKQIIDKIEFSRENNEEFILEIFLKP